MTTDVDALSQLLQTGLINALVSLLTLRRRARRAGVLISRQLALGVAGASLPPLLIATRVVPARVRPRVRARPATRIAAVNAELPGEPLGRAGRAGVRPRGHATSTSFRDVTERLPRRPARRAAAPVALYFPFVAVPVRRCGDAIVLGVGARARARRRVTAGTVHRVPAVPRPVLRADPAALAGVRHVAAGRWRR